MSTATVERNKPGKGIKSPDPANAPRLLNGDHLTVPEFVAEIAVSSAAYDLHEKKAVYQRCLVPEYFVWQVMDSRIHWFALEQGEYVELKPHADGVIRSRIFPGLWLDVRALIANDEDKVSRVLEKGLRSAEHARFGKRLAAGRSITSGENRGLKS